MSADFDPITGIVTRQRLDKPATFKANSHFLKGYKGYSRGTDRGFLVGGGTRRGKISRFDVYADINKNGRLDRIDPYIGSGSVGPRGLGLYESLSVGATSSFQSRDGYFSITHKGTIVAAGELF
jgi:hypothetical protein